MGQIDQLGFETVEKGTAVLDVGDLFYYHATMPMQGKVEGTIDLLDIPEKASVVAWSKGRARVVSATLKAVQASFIGIGKMKAHAPKPLIN